MKLDARGAVLLKNALQQPFRILLANAGLSADAYLTQLKDGEGVDVNTMQMVNLRRAGIIDPAAVTGERAIQNAVSVAGTGIDYLVRFWYLFAKRRKKMLFNQLIKIQVDPVADKRESGILTQPRPG